jgi:5'-3' exonuclease
VDVIVAPYEADAQLAFLSKANIAQLIITEDSDLIVHGCEKILLKMKIEMIGGNGDLYFDLYDKGKFSRATGFDTADGFERFRW